MRGITVTPAPGVPMPRAFMVPNWPESVPPPPAARVIPPGAAETVNVPCWASAGLVNAIAATARMIIAESGLLIDAPHTFPPDLTTGRCVRRRSSYSLNFIVLSADRATAATEEKLADYWTVKVKVTVADFAPVTPAPLAGVTATPIKRVCVEPLAALVTIVSGVAVLTAVKSVTAAGTVAEFAESRTIKILFGAAKSVVTWAVIVLLVVVWLVNTGFKL